MRDYSKFGPRFWIGETGKFLRKLGSDHLVVGMYVFTCPDANMVGLYHLTLPQLSHHTGIPIDRARAILAQLSQGPMEGLGRPFEGVFARYDEVSETIFVTEMARHQIGERLVKRDNRHRAVVKELEQYRKTPFFNDFLARYREDFELQDVPPNKPLRSPSRAPSKPEAGAGAEERAGAESLSEASDPGKGREVDALRPDPDLDPQNHEAWLEVRASYPTHIHPEADWLIAEREASMRVGEGVPWSELKAGCQRLNAQQAAKGNVGTQFVPSPKGMFTRHEKRWRDPYPLPATKSEQRLSSNIDAAAEAKRRLIAGGFK